MVKPMIAIVKESSDIPGTYVAHCVTLDVVTQGDSIQGAFEALGEAIGMIIQADESNGLDPFTREPAPLSEYVEEVLELLSKDPEFKEGLLKRAGQ